MDTSRSSSSSSQHYSVLLQTVSELRTDLEKTMTKIKSLEEQNQTLTNNYQVVKDELVQTRFKYNEAKEGYLNSVAEKFEAERQHEAFMERLKAQLVEKTKDFEIIRDKLVPHDIDQLRIKVQEELEIQHKGQLQAVEFQLDDERSKLFASKREYERIKVQYEVLIQHQQQEIQALRSDHEEVESDLRDRIAKLKEQELVPQKDEKARGSRAQLAELQHMVELLREESKTTKAERDEAMYALEQCKSSHEEVIIHLKSRLALAESDKNAIEEQKAHLSVESERKDGVIRTSRQSIEDLTSRLDQALKQVGEAEKQLCGAREEHGKYLDVLQASMETERNDHQERVDSLSERLAEKEEALRRALRDGAEGTARSEGALTDLRRTHQLELQEARRRFVTLEVEVSELKNSLRSLESESSSQNETSRAEIDSLRADLTKCRRDKDAAQTRARDLEQTAEGSRRKLATALQEHTSKVQALEGNLREVNSKLASYDSKLSQARDSYREIQGALQASKESHGRAEMRVAEQATQLDAMRREFERQVESIVPSYKEQAEKFKKRMSEELSKEKKRAEAYKSKALEAHAKVKTLSQNLYAGENEM